MKVERRLRRRRTRRRTNSWNRRVHRASRILLIAFSADDNTPNSLEIGSLVSREARTVILSQSNAVRREKAIDSPSEPTGFSINHLQGQASSE